jgi:RNA polymerase sigma-70 factor, ECF subfamily
MAKPSAEYTIYGGDGDETGITERIARGDQVAFEWLMRRHNSRLFRVARAILKNDEEAEDALQEAYLDAYQRAATFRGSSQLSTWLTRIVINRALMRLRKQRKERVVVPFDDGSRDSGHRSEIADNKAEPPPEIAMRKQVRRMIERRIDELPIAFRTVFVMREVEEMTAEEVADCLSIPAATVRTRLFRARALLRDALARDVDAATVEVFGFAGDRCDRIVSAVLSRAAMQKPHPGDIQQ